MAVVPRRWVPRVTSEVVPKLVSLGVRRELQGGAESDLETVPILTAVATMPSAKRSVGDGVGEPSVAPHRLPLVTRFLPKPRLDGLWAAVGRSVSRLAVRPRVSFRHLLTRVVNLAD